VKLYFVRHGVSTGNTPGNLIGHSDHPLSDVGDAQARAVAARLAPLGPLPVHASDLPRALATADVIAAEWRRDAIGADVRVDPRLREIDLGDLEGRSWDEYMADEELTAAMAADPRHTRLPGGESLADLEERVWAAIEDILGDLSAADVESGCVVAHDGPIRAVVNHVLAVPAERWWTLTTSHGGLSLVEWSEDWVDVRFVNDTSHLAAPGD